MINSLFFGNPFVGEWGFRGMVRSLLFPDELHTTNNSPSQILLATFAKTIFPKKRDQYGATRRTYTTGSDGGIT